MSECTCGNRTTPGNNGEDASAPQGDDDPFGYLYEDGQAAGATAARRRRRLRLPGPPVLVQPGARGRRPAPPYGQQQTPQQTYGQQVPQQQPYGQPNAHYAAPETQPGGAPTPAVSPASAVAAAGAAAPTPRAS